MWARSAGQQLRKIWEEQELGGDGGHLEESQDQSEVEQLFLLHIITSQSLRVLALLASSCSCLMLPHLACAFLPFCTDFFPPQCLCIHRFGLPCLLMAPVLPRGFTSYRISSSASASFSASQPCILRARI